MPNTESTTTDGVALGKRVRRGDLEVQLLGLLPEHHDQFTDAELTLLREWLGRLT